ncbi:MAG TPA: hypothetical protein VNY07_07860 [Chthoniobacterales bacterium]|nr:hypothetical protein [Chthoniobacterales bacterium]
MASKLYTTKQMGDAGEMLVAAELTLQGIPSFIVPSNWPSYDIVAQPPGRELQKVSVKTRTFAKSGNFVGYNDDDEFDWLAIVILPSGELTQRRIFVIPHDVAKQRSYIAEQREGRGFFVHKLIGWPPSAIPDPAPSGGCGLADYEDNFSLSLEPIRLANSEP